MLSKTTRKAIATTVLIVPALAAVPVMAAYFREDPSILGCLMFGFMTLVIGTPLAAFGCVAVGLPAHAALMRLGWTSMVAYIASGALAGFALAMITTWPYLAVLATDGVFDKGELLFWGSVGAEVPVMLTAIIMLSAPMASLIFWSIRRPDIPPPLQDDA